MEVISSLTTMVKSVVAHPRGTCVVLEGSGVSAGLKDGKIHGISAGANFQPAGQVIRWCKDNMLAVVNEGYVNVELDFQAVQGTRVKVGANGVISKDGTEISNATFTTGGRSAWVHVSAGEYFTPHPDFHMPLESNIEEIRLDV